MKTFLLTLTIWFVGCGTSTETRIEDKHYVLPVPVIRDSVIVRVDTIMVSGEKIVQTDTVFSFKYYPAEKRLVYVVRPDSIRFTIRDTITVVKVLDDPHTFTWKIGFGAIVLACGAGAFGAVKVFKVFV